MPTHSTCSIDGCTKKSRKRGWCDMHYQRWYSSAAFVRLERPTSAERFWAKVNKTESCWLWTGALYSNGYGHFRVQLHSGLSPLAHRWAYMQLVGLIPEGLELDHLCRVRNCVNPAHLEPVIHRENQRRGEGACAIHARKTHCPQGHPYDETNTSVSGGKRYCRTCKRTRASWRLRKGATA